MNRRGFLGRTVGAFVATAVGVKVGVKKLVGWHPDYIIMDDIVNDDDSLYDVEGEYDHVSMEEAMEAQKEINQLYSAHMDAHREAMERTGLWPKRQ